MMLESCLKEWGLEVYCLTMDNAPYNDGMTKYLKGFIMKWGNVICSGDHIHMRCATHVINLVVYEGLKEHMWVVEE